MTKNAELPFLPVDGPCPDPDFCVRMGGCMSGCTQGPGPKFPEDIHENTREGEITLGVEVPDIAVAGSGLMVVIEQPSEFANVA